LFLTNVVDGNPEDPELASEAPHRSARALEDVVGIDAFATELLEHLLFGYELVEAAAGQSLNQESCVFAHGNLLSATSWC
jgi:hypothetical protein